MRAHPAVALAAAVGLSAAGQLLGEEVRGVMGVVLVLGLGATVELLLRELGLRVGVRAAVAVTAPALAVMLIGWFLLVPVVVLNVLYQVSGGALTGAVGRGWRRTALALAVCAPFTAVVGAVAGAGAWSVDEPGPSDPRMVAGNGVVVSRDTHAFLVQQGAVIVAGDGHLDVARFLASPDPTAPLTSAGTHEPYLWRVELGSRDADRVLKKTEMPDHFFNWWTHSGKGLIAGTSAATWAEEQFSKATSSWAAGNPAEAMYRLGAAVHLVDDACAPPHASQYVPDHRAYEEWVVAHQAEYAVTHGGIYQGDFRVRTGHGGPEWSSAHTRGWVDECAHRAAELVLNTAQPPPDDPTQATSYTDTMVHFMDAQRLTAGYLQFFFDSVGGP